MNDYKNYLDNKELCSWCFEEIISEVYALTLNKTYCRVQCMVSDIQWARSFVKEEQEEIELNNEMATLLSERSTI